MFRSSSSSRVSEEYHASSTSPAPSNNPHQSSTSFVGVDQLLPTHSQATRKDKSRIRSAETAIHFIPLLLLICAIILWFFSTPVELVGKGDHSLVGRGMGSITSGDGSNDVDNGIANGRSLLSEDNLGSFDQNHRSSMAFQLMKNLLDDR